jgi:t-SNARE complex subunit (syntaxin)
VKKCTFIHCFFAEFDNKIKSSTVSTTSSIADFLSARKADLKKGFQHLVVLVVVLVLVLVVVVGTGVKKGF